MLSSHDEQLLRRFTRKKKRVDYRERDEDDFGDDDDADKANGQEELQEVDSNAQIRNIYSYDYHGLGNYPPLVRHYVEKLLESGRADVEKLKVIDDECKLILAGAAHGLAHDSVESALLQLCRHFEWDNMKDMVKQVIANCQVCAATSVKVGDRMFKQEAEIPKLVDEPFYRLCCFYTGVLLLRSTTHAPNADDVRALINRVYLQYAILPKEVMTDNGQRFKAASASFPNEWLFIAIHSSWSNGHVERRHRVVNQKLRRIVLEGVTFEDTREWQDVLDRVCGEINNAAVVKAHGISALDMVVSYVNDDILLGTKKNLSDDKREVWKRYRLPSLKASRDSLRVSQQKLEVGETVYVADKGASKPDPRFVQDTIVEVSGSNMVRLSNGSVVNSRNLKVLTELPAVADDHEMN
ncbi:hypothetical protein FOL46_001540, partial [Perkinsus olseni]